MAARRNSWKWLKLAKGIRNYCKNSTISHFKLPKIPFNLTLTYPKVVSFGGTNRNKNKFVRTLKPEDALIQIFPIKLNYSLKLAYITQILVINQGGKLQK